MKSTLQSDKSKKIGFPESALKLGVKRESVAPQLISPWVWGLFILSITIFIASIFLSINRPTLLPFQTVNPLVFRPLPNFLRLPLSLVDIVMPAMAIIAFCLTLIWLPANNFTRLIAHTVVSILAIRYLFWRATATLNTTHWLSVIVSIILLMNELLWISTYLLYLFQTTWTTESKRKQEADRYEKYVIAGEYLPSVDVFVPTYKEPDYVVRRTAIGCLAMDYPNKTVYILDDTRRPHIQKMAEELGCKYITRPDNKFAKAGNLNNALPQTDGELITIMDADFVPFTNFLKRTVGFFQNSKYDLVQTPQFFYNPDYHARNLGISDKMPNDMEHFFGHFQPGRDNGNCVICCGTSYVVRRSSLEAVGGYYTGCCVEDYQTSIKLLTNGGCIAYLNELLSMGESTRTFADFLDQRLRWLQGNVQVYFRKDLHIWTKLNWIQKSFHVSLIFFCFNPVVRLISLIMPLLSLFLGTAPLISSVPEYLYFAAPFAIAFIFVFGWATGKRLSAMWNEVYETAFCFPAIGRLSLILRNPFAKASNATRKGVKTDRKNYNFSHTYPLWIMMGLTVISIVIHYGGYLFGVWEINQHEYVGKEFLLFWSIYNFIIMAVAVLSSIDQPERREVDRFPLCAFCKITIDDKAYWGYTNDLSEEGASLTLNKNNELAKIHNSQDGLLEFVEHGFNVKCTVIRFANQDRFANVALKFQDVALEQHQKLIVLLYCSLEWWKERKKPNGIDVNLEIFSALFNSKSLLSTHKN
ncbi:MAG: glycosyl transferase [Pseudanabaena sp.]|nr:MAG: glycosyl transferase [Pseudanabaena sp.]